LPEWLVERGIGETRAVLVEDDEIVEARIELDGIVPAGSLVGGRLASVGSGGRNAVMVDEAGAEYLLPLGAAGLTEGARITVEVTRERIPGGEPWKRAVAKIADADPSPAPRLEERIGGRIQAYPAPRDRLAEVGWEELVEEARSGIVRFGGGELRVSATPAMTLIDVDGQLAPEELAVVGAAEAARGIRRFDIGGSIGVDLPTSRRKAARQAAAAAIDAALPQPFERTAVNGFGFVQIVRPRPRPSLVELAQDRAAFEARALLRRAGFEKPGPKRLVAHPAVIKLLETREDWVSELARQVGGAIQLRANGGLPMSGGYAEKA
jgi:hypothetical protein